MSRDMESIFAAIDREIEARRERILEDLSSLVSFKTVSGSEDAEEQRDYRREIEKACDFLAKRAAECGLESRFGSGGVFVIERKGGPEVIGLPLHLDVVPVGEGWEVDPFAGEVKEGYVYGRGVLDDKGPIVQMLHALDIVNGVGRRFARTPRLIVAMHEETGDWSDVDTFIREEGAPDVSIVSDSAFPIVNGEKGMIDLRVDIEWSPKEFDDTERFIRFEKLEGGERSNVVPDRARILFTSSTEEAQINTLSLTQSLEDFLKRHPDAESRCVRSSERKGTPLSEIEVTLQGKSAHASSPEKGHNALLDALEYLSTVVGVPPILQDTARFLADSCSSLDGSGLGIQAHHDFIGDATVNLGVLRMSARGARAILNVRSTLGQDASDILETVASQFGSWAADRDVKTDVSFAKEPFDPHFLDPEQNRDLIHSLQTAFERVTGQPGELRAIGGSTFAKAFPRAVCFGPILSGQDENLAHQANERMAVENVLRNTRIYATALAMLALEQG